MRSVKDVPYYACIASVIIISMFSNIGTAIAEEKLCIDVSVEHSAGLFEKQGSDEHACQGKKITHIEFQTKKKGHAGAQIEEQTLPDVTVRWYTKTLSRVTYNLKVWVEE
jgi:hypothetical protein